MGASYSLNRALGMLILVAAAVGCDGKTAEEHLISAQENVAAGEPRVAIIELKNAVQKEPTMGSARALLGQLHYQAGDLESALKELERAVDLGYEDDATILALLNAKNAMGRHNEVLGELEERTDLAPEYAIVLANAYLIGDDIERAKPLFQQGAHLPDGLLGMARIAQLENDLDLALKYLKQLTEEHPDQRDAWLFKGELELEQGDPAAALASFSAGRQLSGGETVGQLGEIRAHLLAEDLAAAQIEVDALIAKSPDFPPAQYLKGLISFQQNDLDSAEAALRVVQQYTRDHLPTLYLMGAVKAQQGQLNQAEDNLRRYLAQDSENVSVSKLLASVYNEQDKVDDIVETLQPIAMQNSDPQLWAMLGSAQLRSGNMEEATNAFQQAVNLAPDMAPFRNQLALSLISAGEDAEAIAELSSAVEMDGDQFQSDYILAMLKLRDQDYEGAALAADTLIEKSADIPIGYDLKGVIALAQQNSEAAEVAFRKALEVDSNYFPAAQNLARLAEQSGDVAAAKKVYEDLLAADANNESATLALVDMVARQGDVASAQAMLADAVVTFPQSVRARLGQLRLLLASGQLDDAEKAAQAAVNLAPNMPDILLLKAEIDLRTGDRSEAERTASKLQGVVGQFDGNKELLAAAGSLQLRLGNLSVARSNLELAVADGTAPINALVSMARLELAEGNTSAAQAQIDVLRERGAQGEELDILQADTRAAQGEMQEALQIYKGLAEAGSRSGTSRYSLAVLQSGDAAEAQRILQDWLAANPEDSGFKLLLANAQIQSGQQSAAKQQYEAMLPTNDPVVLNNLAWIYMSEGDDRAVDMARQADAAAPKNPDIEDTLGWILVKRGEVSEGLDLLRSSARALPDNASVQYHLGYALHQIGDTRAARNALTRAIEIGGFPELSEAQQLLAEL